VHSGTAQAGHYSSIIRLGNHWIQFTDSEIIELTDYAFEESTSGQNVFFDYENISSACLLFYVKVGATLPIGADVLRFDQPVEVAIDHRLHADIEQANEDFVRTQALLNDSVVSFFWSFSDFECVLKYLINVFSHPSLTSRCTEIQ
jgi:hypothetical protein